MKKILDWLIKTFGEKLVAMLLTQYLTVENIQHWLGDLCDFLDAQADKTDWTELDDEAIAILRAALSLPKV